MNLTKFDTIYGMFETTDRIEFQPDFNQILIHV